MERRPPKDPENALRRKLADPAAAREHVRRELARKIYDAKLKILQDVKEELGTRGDFIVIAPNPLSEYEMTGEPAFLKFKNPKQEAEFRKLVAAKIAELKPEMF